MQIPKEKIAHIFFGWKKIPEIIITTPLSLFFETITKKKRENKRSWFLSEKIRKNIGIIKIAPGRACEDVFESLSWFKVKVIHLGFCCAISPYLEIGDVTFIKSSFWKGMKKDSYFCEKRIFPEYIRKVKGLTLNSVLEAYKVGSKFKNTEVIDMETGILYKKIPRSISINVVSDSLKQPFFSLSSHHHKRIRKSIKNTVDFVLKSLLYSI